MNGPLVRFRRKRKEATVKLLPRSAPEQPCVFDSDGQLLEAFRQTCAERSRLATMLELAADCAESSEAAQSDLFAAQGEVYSDPDAGQDVDLDLGIVPVHPWSCHLHASIELSPEIPLAKRLLGAELDPFQREVVLALLAGELGLLELSSTSCAGLVRALELPGEAALDAFRAMSEGSRLLQSGLVDYRDEDDPLAQRDLALQTGLVDRVLNGGDEVTVTVWSVETQDECLAHLAKLVREAERKLNVARSLDYRGFSDHQGEEISSLKIQRQLFELLATLRVHPDWGLSQVYAGALMTLDSSERLVLTLLIAKAAGHRTGSGLWTTDGLSAVLADDQTESESYYELFGADARLVKEQLIQPAHNALLLAEDPEAMARVEWEASDELLAKVGLERKVSRRRLKSESRAPALTLDALVLNEDTQEALRMACAQARHHTLLMQEWGLADVVAYGRSVTLLFEGPPGVGKTAAAEGLAAELGCNILVANYAQIQDCYVGKTEKHIVSLFRTARCEGALLFWDEADAMFYSRDIAHRSFEVRHVNVLLQELERFDGVVVLATNRAVALDAALERRISLKVRFDRPERDLRAAIWSKLIPVKMPVADDVDLEQLAEADLVGGEIKNVVLNAARIALLRGADARVTMADFEKALGFEQGGKWTAESLSGIGFTAS